MAKTYKLTLIVTVDNETTGDGLAGLVERMMGVRDVDQEHGEEVTTCDNCETSDGDGYINFTQVNDKDYCEECVEDHNTDVIRETCSSCDADVPVVLVTHSVFDTRVSVCTVCGSTW